LADSGALHKIFVQRTIFSLTIRQAVPKFKAVAAHHFAGTASMRVRPVTNPETARTAPHGHQEED
jgi:hypothetical protein